MSRLCYPRLMIVLTLPLIVGCGRGTTEFGPMGSVSGRLTMDGAPLEAGTQLLFMQMDSGYAAFAKTDAEGNYEIKWMREGKTWDQVPVGTYKVLVQPPAVQDIEELDPEAMLEGADEDIAPAKPTFPRRYQRHTTSGLECTVAEGENTCNFDLESK